MNVKIIYNQFDNEYVAFVQGINLISGYGLTEKEAVIDFLTQCVDNPLFNQSVVQQLLKKI
jgi:hypothetical protein